MQMRCVRCVNENRKKRKRLRLLHEIFTQQTQAPANRNAQSKQWQPTQALTFLAVFVYVTHATQAIAFEWKPGLRQRCVNVVVPTTGVGRHFCLKCTDDVQLQWLTVDREGYT